MGLSILKLLLPHLIDFVASLLNPNRPGPTLERMSILLNVLLIVLLGYLAHGAWSVHEQHVETRSKFEVTELKNKHLEEDVDEFRDKNAALAAEIERLKSQLDACVPTAPVAPKPKPTPVKKPEVKKSTAVKPPVVADREKLINDINHG